LEGKLKTYFGYSGTFWNANFVELLERSAFYAMFISITLYLTDVVGFTDIETGIIVGVFSSGLYLLPMFTGTYSDKIGFRKAIILAFAMLTVGYFTLAFVPTKLTVLLSLAILMFGGSFIKSIIAGTVAKSSTAENRAKAFSIFYMLVNVGSFLGKTFAYPIRLDFGVQWINIYAGGLSLVAFIMVLLFYRNVDANETNKTLDEIINGFKMLLTNRRLMILIVIVSGFWIIQQQLYASMPKYVIRLIGEEAKPEWIANVNPLVVVTMVYLVTELMKRFKAITAMSIGMLLMPLSAFTMATGHILGEITGNSISIIGFSMHPITLMMIVGIVFQGLAESFISPRYLEYFSLQAPKGEEGLYMGFSHLDSFISNLLGFILSGFLLDTFCPNPKLPQYAGIPHEQLYANAHYLWYVFAGIGLLSAISLLIYGRVYNDGK
jgi:dipeptide/tripeptide permease